MPSAGKSKGDEPGRQYRRLRSAVAEMLAIGRGERTPSRAWEVVADGRGGFVRRPIHPAKLVSARREAKTEVQAARAKLGLSQHTFAALLGVSSGTLQGWEQGRRQPSKAARVLLRVAARHPEVVLEAAHAA